MDAQQRAAWASLADFAALLVSGVAAAVAPLQTLMLAFGLLGPFHYLTEMAWLRKKNFYFNEGLVPAPVYAGGAIVLAFAGFVGYTERRDLTVWIVGLLLVLSLSVWMRNTYWIAAVAVAALVTGVYLRTWVYFLGVMVPTLVHVFFFTWTFMVSGALRGRQGAWPRWVNPGLLLAIPLALFFLPVRYAEPGGFWLKCESETFGAIHQKLAGDLHHVVAINQGLLNDPVAAGLLRLFAFVYLFHYLNWFTKTELLNWHKTSRRVWTGIWVLYAASASFYLWDFRLGFLAATFLSLLHVLLEFPLNWHTLRFLSGHMRPTSLRVTEQPLRTAQEVPRP
jgi:hypothetical protein